MLKKILIGWNLRKYFSQKPHVTSGNKVLGKEPKWKWINISQKIETWLNQNCTWISLDGSL
jgi:hypothetical protein